MVNKMCRFPHRRSFRFAVPRPRPGAHKLRHIYVVALLALFPFGGAQTLRLGLVGSGGAFGLEPGLVLRDLAVEGLELDVRAAVGRTGALEFGVRARSSTSFGPVGNLELRGAAQVDTEGALELSAAGEGTVASVAARFGLSVFNANPGRFEPLNAFGYEVGSGDFTSGGFGLTRPPVKETAGARTWGVFGRLGATYRLDRKTLLELDPSLLYVREGLGVGLQGAVQVRRLRGRDDGAARVLAFLDGGAGAGLGGSYGAAGFEYRHNPPTGPLLRGSLWLGGGERGVRPGARLELLQSGLNTGLRYTIELAAEPYRTDVPPYRLGASLQTPAGPGAFTLNLLGGAGVSAPYPAPRFVLGASYDLPF